MPRRNPDLSKEREGSMIPLTPDRTALVATYDTTISAATDIVLDANTTFIEVNAIGEGVFLRYAATASSANFDEYIAADTTRHYIIPDNVTTISVIERAASAIVAIIQK